MGTSKLIRVFGELKPRHEETALDSPEVVARQTHATRSDTTRSDNHVTVILKTKADVVSRTDLACTVFMVLYKVDRVRSSPWLREHTVF